MSKYSHITKSCVQHAINNIIFQADRGFYEPNYNENLRYWEPSTSQGYRCSTTPPTQQNEQMPLFDHSTNIQHIVIRSILFRQHHPKFPYIQNTLIILHQHLQHPPVLLNKLREPRILLFPTLKLCHRLRNLCSQILMIWYKNSYKHPKLC